MNKILSIILCFQLILIQSVFADDVFVCKPENYSNANESTTNYDPLAASKPDPSQQNFFNKDCANCEWDDYFQQFFVLALGTVGSTIITQCPIAFSSPSMWAFILGTATQITSEIFLANELSTRHREGLDKLKMKESKLKNHSKGTLDQLELFKAAKADEEQLRDFISRKIVITYGIMATYVLAGVIALFEQAKYIVAPVTLASGDVGCNPILWPKHEVITKIVNTAIAGAFTWAVSSQSQGNLNFYGGILMMILGLFSDVITTSVPLLFGTPTMRTVTFGALGVLQGPVVGFLHAREGIVDENIKKLQCVIDNFKVSTGSLEQTLEEDGGGDGPKKREHRLKELTKVERGGDACEKSSNPKACRETLKDLHPPKFDFGDLGILNDGMKSAAGMSNAMRRGDFAGASLHASTLHNMSGRLRKIGQKLQKKINETLKAQGKPTMDYDKETKQRVSMLQGEMRKALAANNISSPNDLKGAGGAAQKELDKLTSKNVAKAAPAAPVDPSKNLDVFDEEETVAEAAPTEEIQKSGDNLDKFDVQEADISKKSDVSIFVQLSNRYILNYTKIFKKLEIQPPAPTPTQASPQDLVEQDQSANN